MLDRFEAACTAPRPAPRFPFGGVHLGFTRLADPPMHALPIPQQGRERVLEERVSELGVDLRRGHEVTGVRQDDTAVTVDVRGPDGPRRMTARYLVGCDGARSRIRDLAGIPFAGTTCPEVNRLAQVTLPGSVTVLDDGALDVAGAATIQAGFTRTDHGLFGIGAAPGSEVVSLYTITACWVCTCPSVHRGACRGSRSRRGRPSTIVRAGSWWPATRHTCSPPPGWRSTRA